MAESCTPTETSKKEHAGESIPDSTQLRVTPDEFAAICDATVRLTEIRQRGCKHLCVENVAPEIMRKLLLALSMHKRGLARSEDLSDYEATDSA